MNKNRLRALAGLTEGLNQQRAEEKLSQSDKEFKSSPADIENLFKNFEAEAKKANIAIDKKQVPNIKSKIKAAVAGAKTTREALSKMPAPSPEMISKVGALANSGLKDEISDEQAAKNAGVSNTSTRKKSATVAPDDVKKLSVDDQPPGKSLAVTPDTLPAVINKAMSTSSHEADIEWHQVKHLPGYLQNSIRAIGRKVFTPFTKTPIEEIQVVANVQDGGPNDAHELNSVASWLKYNGIRDNEAMLEFGKVLPDYKAEVVIYNTNGVTFMMVKDFAGQYIYSWPGGRGVHIDHEDTAKLTKK